MSYLETYQYVREYDPNFKISNDIIKNLLEKTWKVTPSKNNFMPYKVHVIGPTHQHLKEKIYKKCLENEGKNDSLGKIKKVQEARNYKANFYNIVNCSHLLFFTQRVETILNPYQQLLVDRGFQYEQMHEKDLDIAKSNSLIEVGMFCSTFGAMCLDNGIDISHTLCFPKQVSAWKSDPDFNFIDSRGLLIMTIGKGLIYRQDVLKSMGLEGKDNKPDFNRIVNILEN